MKEKYYVLITLTNKKTIEVCLESKYAPKSVENFVNLVKSNYYNGTIFHRIIENFMIQTGGYNIVENTLCELPEIPSIVGEFASNGHPENTLKHELGVISMARTGVKDSATSQFFICAADCPWLDGEYAAFGKVVDEASKEVVLEVSRVETGNLGGGFTDFPYDLIGIESIVLLDK